MVDFAAFAILFAIVYIGDFLLFFIERALSRIFDRERLAPHKFKDLTWQSGNLGKPGEILMIAINWVFLIGIVLFVLPALEIPRNGASYFLLIVGTFVGWWLFDVFLSSMLFGLLSGDDLDEQTRKDHETEGSILADIRNICFSLPGAFPFTLGFFSVIATGYELFRWLFSEVIAIPAAASLGGLVVFGWCAAWLGIQADKPPSLNRNSTATPSGREHRESDNRGEESPPVQSTNQSASTHSDSDPISSGTESSSHIPRAPASADFSSAEYGWGYSKTRFSDIGGYYDLKRALTDEIIQPLQAAQRGSDRFSRFGIEPERGVLFFGPPGTGKTIFARALAGELNVPFVELSPADVTSQWINEGPEKIRQLFAEAESVGPCVIFIDEAEHLFGARADGSRNTHAEDRKMTTEFLVHLTREERKAIVIAATNRPEDIDPAILRPGRLTAQFELGLPDSEGRHAILQSKLARVPAGLSGDDLAELAEYTPGFSGADLTEFVDEAKRSAARRDAEAVIRDDFPTTEALEEASRSLTNAAERGVEELPDADEPSDVPVNDNDREGRDSIGYQ